MGTRGNRGKAPWSVYSDRGIATLNAKVAGKRCRVSLGLPYDPATASARDVRAVEEAAARKYGELVAGRVLEVGPRARIMTSHTLHELFALWLVEAQKLWPKSYRTRITQIGNVETWSEEAVRFKGDTRTPIERLCDDAGPSQYGADRLTQVIKDTVAKELSNLYAFFAWAVLERHLATAPPRPHLPRSAQGVRTGTQREKPVDITEAEAIAICEAMPEWTAKGGRNKGQSSKHAMRVRDAFRLSWELALRPGHVQQLETPRHFSKGQAYVWISRDIDKTGTERRIPLTEVAREILERCAPAEGGLIFGRHDLRLHIKRAAEAVLGPARAKQFAAYDFRHGRAVHSAEVTGSLLGTQRLLGHSQPTTTNRYLRTRESHLEEVMGALDAVRKRSGEATGDGSGQEAVVSNQSVKQEQVRRRGLEPLRCYPLAPQGRGQQLSPEDLGGRCRQSTSQNVDEFGHDDTTQSGIGQEAVTTAQRVLVVQSAIWDAFDAFTLSADLDDEGRK